MRISKKLAPQSKAALGRYLAAGLGATGLASVDSEAGIVNINVSSVSGVNAGLPNGGSTTLLLNFPVPATGFNIYNNVGYSNYFGLYPTANTRILTGSTDTSPVLLTQPQQVSASLSAGQAWSGVGNRTLFKYESSESSNFGANSYIGFRLANPAQPADFYYGYLEVTWNNSTDQFQILSGAYENTPNTPIAVPEPSTIALTSIGALALGAGAVRRSRKARKAAAEGTLAEAV